MNSPKIKRLHLTISSIQSMSERFKPLAEGLGPLLKALEQRAQAHTDLAARVREALPEPEKHHILSAAYRGDTLVVSADSAAWASRLRYAQEQLLADLRAQNVTQISKIKIRVGRSDG